MGDPHPGEGVFGLRRAFQVAGARRLVMSLWKVDDQATRELMEAFYPRLRKGLPADAALREAQLERRRNGADPELWGAFIFEGVPEAFTLSS